MEISADEALLNLAPHLEIAEGVLLRASAWDRAAALLSRNGYITGFLFEPDYDRAHAEREAARQQLDSPWVGAWIMANLQLRQADAALDSTSTIVLDVLGGAGLTPGKIPDGFEIETAGARRPEGPGYVTPIRIRATHVRAEPIENSAEAMPGPLGWLSDISAYSIENGEEYAGHFRVRRLGHQLAHAIGRAELLLEAELAGADWHDFAALVDHADAAELRRVLHGADADTSTPDAVLVSALSSAGDARRRIRRAMSASPINAYLSFEPDSAFEPDLNDGATLTLVPIDLLEEAEEQLRGALTQLSDARISHVLRLLPQDLRVHAAGGLVAGFLVHAPSGPTYLAAGYGSPAAIAQRIESIAVGGEPDGAQPNSFFEALSDALRPAVAKDNAEGAHDDSR
ncbi:hypothetical protein GCM10022288_15610 [Gryllotalpicola kribbensis]|uniref:Uncharacterized protein n=1 Tax=Gryllotalpicola kribbensis TaxID=993084 RepID=A0ABP8ARI7_9MICO